MMSGWVRVVCAFVLGVMSMQVHGGSPLLWQSNSVSYLYGDGFTVNPARQHTLTLEHVSGWRYGDLFAFVDATRFADEEDVYQGRQTWYGEFSPRLSFGKMLGREFSAGPVSDLLLAATWETGKGEVESLLLGTGLDLQFPGFDYFQLNVYRRMPQNNRDGQTWQLTPVWGMRFPLAGSTLVFDGFIDWVPQSEGSYSHNLHLNPQLKYDLGQRLGWGGQRFYAGLEYSYWQNKYGIRHSPAFKTNQRAYSLLLKWHF